MSSLSFEELVAFNNEHHRAVCAGLDPTLLKIPGYHPDDDIEQTLVDFLLPMVEVLPEVVGMIKPNFWFYAGKGSAGLRALERLFAHMQTYAPNVIKTLDLKGGDIGPTNDEAITLAFDILKADAVTLHNYMGMQGMKPYLDRGEKGCFVLVRTSNQGADVIQKLPVQLDAREAVRLGFQESAIFQPDPMYLFEFMARHLAVDWNFNGNVGAVAGCTEHSIEDLATIRRLMGQGAYILSPGAGKKQGGDANDAFEKGCDKQGGSIAVNSSSGITHAHLQEQYEGFVPAEAALAEATVMHDGMEQRRASMVA